MTRDELDQLIREHGRYAYHQVSERAQLGMPAADAVSQILEQGLIPRDVDYDEMQNPRRGVVYLMVEDGGLYDEHEAQLRVDLTKLDPEMFTADEDAFDPTADDAYELDGATEFPFWSLGDWYDAYDETGVRPITLGEWAEENAELMDQGSHVLASAARRGAVGYKGVLPAHAIERNPLHRPQLAPLEQTPKRMTATSGEIAVADQTL